MRAHWLLVWYVQYAHAWRCYKKPFFIIPAPHPYSPLPAHFIPGEVHLVSILCLPPALLDTPVAIYTLERWAVSSIYHYRLLDQVNGSHRTVGLGHRSVSLLDSGQCLQPLSPRLRLSPKEPHTTQVGDSTPTDYTWITQCLCADYSLVSR